MVCSAGWVWLWTNSRLAYSHTTNCSLPYTARLIYLHTTILPFCTTLLLAHTQPILSCRLPPELLPASLVELARTKCSHFHTGPLHTLLAFFFIYPLHLCSSQNFLGATISSLMNRPCHQVSFLPHLVAVTFFSVCFLLLLTLYMWKYHNVSCQVPQPRNDKTNSRQLGKLTDG